jgi:hypothetical protein
MKARMDDGKWFEENAAGMVSLIYARLEKPDGR